MTIRVIVADDHPIFLAGVSALFQGIAGVQIVATAGSSYDLIQVLSTHACDVLLTDFSMPGSRQLDGMVMLRRLQRDFPALRIIVVTMHDNPGVLGSIAQLKIAGLVSKSDIADEIVTAVQSVAEDRSYLSRYIRQTLGIDLLSRLPEKTRLSPRESEVLRLFASGLKGNQIAAQLHRSKKTVSRQKINAFHKLGLSSDVEFFVFLRETRGTNERLGMNTDLILGSPPAAGEADSALAESRPDPLAGTAIGSVGENSGADPEKQDQPPHPRVE